MRINVAALMATLLVAGAFTGPSFAQSGTDAFAQAGSRDRYDDRITILLGFVSEPYDVGAPVRTIKIGNPDVVDVETVAPAANQPGAIESNRYVNLVGKKEGLTNVLFIGNNGELLKNVFVAVDATASPLGSGYMHLHNKINLNSFMAFRCDRRSCKYLGENTTKEQELEERRSARVRQNVYAPQAPEPERPAAQAPPPSTQPARSQ